MTPKRFTSSLLLVRVKKNFFFFFSISLVFLFSHKIKSLVRILLSCSHNKYLFSLSE